MKRTLTILTFFLSYGILLHDYVFAITNRDHIEGNELLKALQQRSIEPTRVALQKITRRYSSDPLKLIDVLNTRRKDGSTPLMLAASFKTIDRLSLFLNTLAMLSKKNPLIGKKVILAQDNHGKSALYHTVERKNKKATELLLDSAAQLFKNNTSFFFDFLMLHTSHTHWTPLMNATFQSASNVVEILVEKAQSVLGEQSPQFKNFINVHDVYGRSALFLAIEPWDRLFLLNHGAHQQETLAKTPLYTKQLEMGKKLLHYVSHVGHEKDLKNLLDEAKIIFKDDEKDYFFFVTTRDHAGWTALMNAAADGHEHYISIFMQGVQEYFKDQQMEMLLLNQTDIHGRSALHLAIQRRHFKSIKALLENEKKLFGNNKKFFMRFINEQGELNGFTPLIVAAEISTDDSMSFEVIQLLVERAKEVLQPPSLYFDEFINARDLDNKTALAYAINKKIAHYLKKNGAHL